MLQDRTWFLIGRKMANEASSEELLELEEILRSNPELHFTLQTISGISLQEPSDNYLQIDQAYSAHLQRLKEQGFDLSGDEETQIPEVVDHTSPPPRRRIPYLLVAAFIGVIAIAFYLTDSGSPAAGNLPKTSSEISTKNGSKTYIQLPDGTRVWLNAGSKVSYDKQFGENLREVVLTGEAYFDVTHNPNKPFIIHTAAMDIRVLGTEFNVRSYPDEEMTETSLIRGSIEVTLRHKRAGKIVLKPNEKLVVSNEARDTVQAAGKAKKAEPIINLGGLNYFSQDSTILETSWVQNRLVFEDESFADIARLMERWYAVDFIFEDSEIENLRFTGNFRDESVAQALEAMKITGNFNYSINNNTITIRK